MSTQKTKTQNPSAYTVVECTTRDQQLDAIAHAIDFGTIHWFASNNSFNVYLATSPAGLAEAIGDTILDQLFTN